MVIEGSLVVVEKKIGCHKMDVVECVVKPNSGTLEVYNCFRLNSMLRV